MAHGAGYRTPGETAGGTEYGKYGCHGADPGERKGTV